ncbi:hypothetical protein V6N13_096994 [Hibiscus sabdariffa]
MKFCSCFSNCFFLPSETAITNISQQDPQGENDENFTVFSYSELKLATRGFSAANKIGEGAFGCVYKGLLANGSIVAVKMLSIELESMRGEREFVSEISTLTNLKHENLVTLKGCCIDGAKRLLVYNYMENNSLAQILLGMNYPEEEVDRFIKVGLLCVQEKARLRPEMSMALKMLRHDVDIELDQISQPGMVADLMNIKLGQKTTLHGLYSKASNLESTPSPLSSCS